MTGIALSAAGRVHTCHAVRIRGISGPLCFLGKPKHRQRECHDTTCSARFLDIALRSTSWLLGTHRGHKTRTGCHDICLDAVLWPLWELAPQLTPAYFRKMRKLETRTTGSAKCRQCLQGFPKSSGGIRCIRVCRRTLCFLVPMRTSRMSKPHRLEYPLHHSPGGLATTRHRVCV